MSTKAFSDINPALQIVWDASSLKSVQFCPRHYQYNNLEGWQVDKVDLVYGRLIASALELYQKARLDGKTKTEATLAAVRWALEETWYPEVEEAHDLGEHHDVSVQWGGRYETLWKCEGTTPYKNDKGNRAKCPFAFERSWFPGDPPAVCGVCRSGIKTERRYVPDDDKKNRHSLIRAIIWYADDQPEELEEGLYPYTFPNGQKAVELSGKLPLPYSAQSTGERYVLAYNFDYIGVFGQELFIVDNKTTTKSLNDKFFNGYSPDTQFDTYDMIGSLVFPAIEIKGTLVDAIQVMVGGVEFGRRPFYKTEEQREEHLADLQSWLEAAEGYAVRRYWPMNKRSCWLCPFSKVCSLPPSQREGYLKSNFTKGERWNPARER